VAVLLARILQGTSEHLALVFFALAGCVVLTGFGNLTMLFLGIEIVSIAGYVLAGSDKRSARSGEAALKYFLLGAFATGFLRRHGHVRFGRHPGVAGAASRRRARVFLCGHRAAHRRHGVQGIGRAVSFLGARCLRRFAGAGDGLHFQQGFAPIYAAWAPAVAALAAVTILAGNLMAVAQKSFKRLLAYSSIAHAGYMLMALAALDQASPGALLYYAGTYSFASLAVFKLVDGMRGDESVAALWPLSVPGSNGWFCWPCSARSSAFFTTCASSWPCTETSRHQNRCLQDRFPYVFY
jgi:NADH-quinone oxidoreductase subunit N